MKTADDLFDGSNAHLLPEMILLKRAAGVLRAIRLKSACWEEYPGAKELLDDLYKGGYA